MERRLGDAAAVLKARPEHLARRIEVLLDENRKLERRVEELITRGPGTGDEGRVERLGDVELHILETDLDDRNQIGLMLDAFRAGHRRAVALLFATGGRQGIHVAVTEDLVREGVKAPELANAVAAVTGGKGGGRPHFASAGAGGAAPMAVARDRAPAIVRELLAR
jgi:alanyl-tRNA synthetase